MVSSYGYRVHGFESTEYLVSRVQGTQFRGYGYMASRYSNIQAYYNYFVAPIPFIHAVIILNLIVTTYYYYS